MEWTNLQNYVDPIDATDINLIANQVIANESAISQKANSSDVYTKNETDAKFDNKDDKLITYAEYKNDYKNNLILTGYDANNNSNSIVSLTPFIPLPFISGQIIESIKFNAATLGTISFGMLKKSAVVVGTAYHEADYTLLTTYEVNQLGVQEINFKIPLYINDDCVFCIGGRNDTATFKYGTSGNKGFLTCRNDIYTLVNAYSLGVDIYAVNANINHNNIYYNREIHYKGYDERNVTISKIAAAPYIVSEISGCFVTSVYLNVRTTGQLSFGYVDTAKLILGNVIQLMDLGCLAVKRLTQIGPQKITFDNPIYIPPNAALAISVLNNDSVTFYYGKNGAETEFYCGTTLEHKYYLSANNLGIDIEIITEDPVSALKGKKLSIFGDSISTFAGYIPSGNAVYYTGDNCDVNLVADTWWMKTIKALNLKLLVNNSWSGRAVSNVRDNQSAHATDAGYKEANVLALKSGDILPDIIIVKLGINDFNYEAPLGNYDGSGELPTNPTNFLDAYAIMLNLIMTNFPLAKIYCCTLMPCEKNGNIGFPEINGNGDSISDFNEGIIKLANAFGAEILNHHLCGLTYYNLAEYMGDYTSGTQTGLHPNKKGHSLIANKTISELDNCVRIRF